MNCKTIQTAGNAKASANDNLQNTQPSFIKVADGFNFPEGPAWDGINSVYVSNCAGGRISRITPHGVSDFLKASDDPFTLKSTNGLTVFADGSLFACDFGTGAILKISPDGKTEIYAAGFQGKRFNRPNDLAFDPAGNLYFTDPNQYNRNIRDGIVYRIGAQPHTVTPVATGLAFPNGLAFSADAKNLFICESAMERIWKFSVQPDGSLTNSVVFAELPGGDPDGIGFDQAGNLYVAHFGGGALYIFNPDGTIKQKIPTPGQKPSNIEFTGSDLRTLYLTEDETNAVYQLPVETPGLPLFSSPASTGVNEGK